MTCRDVAGFLLEHRAGEMPPQLVADFEGHLKGCSNCRVLAAQYQQTIALCAAAVAGADVPPAPDELVSDVLRAISTAGAP